MENLQKIKSYFSNRIIVPKAFDDFYHWTAQQNEHYGSYYISGCFEWRADDYDAIKHWFGSDCNDRFGVFGAGSTGNLYAFWIDDSGQQKIVHLGSEGDELLVLGNTFIEFLQYLSIGYDDPSSEDFHLTINEIQQRDKVDYSFPTEQMEQYYHDTKKLQTDEGIVALFEGVDLSQEELDSIKKTMKNTDFSYLQPTPENKKAYEEQVRKNEQKALEDTKRLNEFQQWLSNSFGVNSPKRATDISYLQDKSFANWVAKHEKYLKE